MPGMARVEMSSTLTAISRTTAVVSADLATETKTWPGPLFLPNTSSTHKRHTQLACAKKTAPHHGHWHDPAAQHVSELRELSAY
jgi:hypothetical protein